MFSLMLLFLVNISITMLGMIVLFSLQSYGQSTAEYGVDVSFPIFRRKLAEPNGIHAQRYERAMKGCYDMYSKQDCDATERARMAMNLAQPPSEYNYTEIGFKKTKVPAGIWAEIKEFWDTNKHRATKEEWGSGNTYVNNWESPSYMVSFENRALRGGQDLKERIWAALKPIISEWVGGKELIPTSLYGIRMYTGGSILAPHVDRLPLVSSAIIQVAQDVDEDWPAEVYSHDGQAYNVSMQPGDMCLYESHTVLHGRPFPMKGRYYANIFVHFKPVDHDETNEKYFANQRKLGESSSVTNLFKHHTPSTVSSKHPPTSSKIKWIDSRTHHTNAGHEHFQHDEEEMARHLEDIRLENMHKAEDELEKNSHHLTRDEEEARLLVVNSKDLRDGRTALHVAAARGDLTAVKRILDALEVMEGAASSDSNIIHARDANEWQAIHEAARGGHLDVLVYLVDHGADLTSLTKSGDSVLDWARRSLVFNHPVIKYLEDHNAPEF